MPRRIVKTSWGGVAKWYDDVVEGEGSYQKELIVPNLLRLLDIQKGEAILDVACGQGFFAREFFKKGAHVIGVDISGELIAIAQKKSPKDILYRVVSADNLSFLKNGSTDKAAMIFAVQNIENVQGVFRECARALKPAGKLFIVMNHPAFRVPQESGWGWDEKEKIQYRRIDQYLSESKVKIQMHPGSTGSPQAGAYTVSFHRPLQYYFKALEKSGFAVTRFEEWGSAKKSMPGPRAKAEDRARKEFPLFLFLEACKG